MRAMSLTNWLSSLFTRVDEEPISMPVERSLLPIDDEMPTDPMICLSEEVMGVLLLPDQDGAAPEEAWAPAPVDWAPVPEIWEPDPGVSAPDPEVSAPAPDVSPTPEVSAPAPDVSPTPEVSAPAPDIPPTPEVLAPTPEVSAPTLEVSAPIPEEAPSRTEELPEMLQPIVPSTKRKRSILSKPRPERRPQSAAPKTMRLPSGRWVVLGPEKTTERVVGPPAPKPPEIQPVRREASAGLGLAAWRALRQQQNRDVPTEVAIPRDMVQIPAVQLLSAYDGGVCRVASFLMGELPVTGEQYAAFLRENPRADAPSHWRGRIAPSGEARTPVVGVPFAGAAAYASWCGARLPTEAEWQAAARTPDQRRFPWGDLWVPEHCVGPQLGLTMPAVVGSRPKGVSASGCLDLVGNVWEWTEPAVSGQHWVFGGSFRHPGAQPEGIARANLPARRAFPYVGFRCARDLGGRS